VKPASYWKLGAFVVAGAALSLAALVYLSSGLLGRSTVDYQVFFDESVQGLEVGSLVRFRGVTLGQVTGIRVAPDRRRIQVTCALRTSDIRKEGLEIVQGRERLLALPPELRAQLAIIGLTGQEIVALDFFDPETHPVPDLPFVTPPRTIPSTPSPLANIASSLERAGAEVPALITSLQQLAGETVALLASIRAGDLPGRAGATLSRVDKVLAGIQRLTDRLSAERTPESIAQAVTSLDGALSSLRALLEGLGGERGLLGHTQLAADALVGTTQAASPLGRQLEATLRDAQGTLQAIRRLADTVEREPDVLLKGRGGHSP
jgi:ABC-type transporter Mla subunit MlaD